MYGVDAEIKMNIEINKGLIDRWERQGRTKESLINRLGISEEITNFSDCLEKYLLRGQSVEFPFTNIKLIGGDKSDGFFCESTNTLIINNNEKNAFYEAIINIQHEFEYRSGIVLMSNPKYYNQYDDKAQYKNLLKINKLIPIKEKDFIWVLNLDEYNPPFRYYENNFSIDVAYGGGLNTNLRYVFLLYWCGVLEINNKEAIKCIKIAS